jgi:hypothetical protein
MTLTNEEIQAQKTEIERKNEIKTLESIKETYFLLLESGYTMDELGQEFEKEIDFCKENTEKRYKEYVEKNADLLI